MENFEFKSLQWKHHKNQISIKLHMGNYPWKFDVTKTYWLDFLEPIYIAFKVRKTLLMYNTKAFSIWWPQMVSSCIATKCFSIYCTPWHLLVAKCKRFLMAQVFIYFFLENCVQKNYTFNEPKMETKSKYFSCK
jgi:hypothetical protein